MFIYVFISSFELKFHEVDGKKKRKFHEYSWNFLKESMLKRQIGKKVQTSRIKLA